MEEIRRLQKQLSPEGQAWWAEAQRLQAQRLHSSQASPEEEREERLGQINRWRPRSPGFQAKITTPWVACSL